MLDLLWFDQKGNGISMTGLFPVVSKQLNYHYLVHHPRPKKSSCVAVFSTREREREKESKLFTYQMAASAPDQKGVGGNENYLH